MATADCWSQLPIDMCCLIIGNLDLLADRIRFRSTCKTWRSSIHPPLPPAPWLFLSDIEGDIYHDERNIGEVVNSDYSETESETEEQEQNIGVVAYGTYISETESEEEEQKEEEQDEEKEKEEEEEKEEKPPLRGLVGVGDQQIYELQLPEAYQARCVGSTGNWLITIDLLGMICLLNPFSRVQLYLPPHSTFPSVIEYQISWAAIPVVRRDGTVWKTILSSSPNNNNGRDCIAISIHGARRSLATARPGDASWITIDSPVWLIDDVAIYKERLYAVNIYGIVLVCHNFADGQSPKASILMDRFPLYKLDEDTKKYLVEWMGELLLVIKILKDEVEPTYYTASFEVYKLDFTNKKWDRLKSLEDYSLFLGFNTSVSVLPSDYSHSVKKNCIYFTDDFICGYKGITKGGRDMGVFDLQTNSIQPHYEGISRSFYSPPIWIIPTVPKEKLIMN